MNYNDRCKLPDQLSMLNQLTQRNRRNQLSPLNQCTQSGQQSLMNGGFLPDVYRQDVMSSRSNSFPGSSPTNPTVFSDANRTNPSVFSPINSSSCFNGNRPGSTLARAMFYSNMPQTVPGDGLTPVIFTNTMYATGGITNNNGVITLPARGVYSITYQIYPSAGASSNTVFGWSNQGSSIHVPYSTAVYSVDNTLVSSSFLYSNNGTATRNQITVIGGPVSIPGTPVRAKIVIQQLSKDI